MCTSNFYNFKKLKILSQFQKFFVPENMEKHSKSRLSGSFFFQHFIRKENLFKLLGKRIKMNAFSVYQNTTLPSQRYRNEKTASFLKIMLVINQQFLRHGTAFQLNRNLFFFNLDFYFN